MKKALIITYYWPPAGGPGVQRVLNIVEHLPEWDWEPVVLTVENPSAPAKDESLLSRIPPTCKVYRTRTREPFSAYKTFTGKKAGSVIPKNISFDKNTSPGERLSRWVRANLFIPDARKGWKNFMVQEGLKIIESEKPDVIFSTSPPHSLQLGAKQLAKKSGIPWVVDLRDPWTEAYWETQMPKTERSKRKNLAYERQVLSAADHITTVGPGVLKLIKDKTTQPASVIYNGYRDLDNEFISSEYFEIVHLGNLSSMQSCDELIEAVKRLPEEKKKKLKLVFIGTLADEYMDKIERNPDINVEYIKFLPYDNMLTRARSASMLFLPRLNSSYSKGLISAKLFDYLALRRPIIAIADKGSDIEGILQHTGNGKSFLSGEVEGVRDFISENMDHASKGPDMILPRNTEQDIYASRKNVQLLVEIFENSNKTKSLLKPNDLKKFRKT